MTNEEIISEETIGKISFVLSFFEEFGRMPKMYEFNDYYVDKTEGRIKTKEPVVHSRKEKLRRDYEDKFGNPPVPPMMSYDLFYTEKFYDEVEKCIETGVRLEDTLALEDYCPPNCVV